ncbi:coiled-coil domain-containing protein CG32809-like isoform X3 [Mya arenaria]|uniref:coiled-coil domain-containing protein CG32809-like isoform X3 n=1 Tax=Mya arenaria TaxID=6604 RepID=UPI0022E213D2|nr:coiled-coil domain-containing protein CG32809-like isoform X3 [Mya arenaria]
MKKLGKTIGFIREGSLKRKNKEKGKEDGKEVESINGAVVGETQTDRTDDAKVNQNHYETLPDKKDEFERKASSDDTGGFGAVSGTANRELPKLTVKGYRDIYDISSYQVSSLERGRRSRPPAYDRKMSVGSVGTDSSGISSCLEQRKDSRALTPDVGRMRHKLSLQGKDMDIASYDNDEHTGFKQFIAKDMILRDSSRQGLEGAGDLSLERVLKSKLRTGNYGSGSELGSSAEELIRANMAPTQSITNGDRTDNSDESSSIRGANTVTRERSRSQDRESHERRGDHHGNRERPSTSRDHDYGVIQSQPRSSRGKRSVPRRHTVGGAGMKREYDVETERSKDAFMEMLASRYPQYAEKISSTTSEDGFPVRGRSRDPRRRATVGYGHHNRSMEYDGTVSEVDGPTFHRGGFVRSSLPAARSPTAVEKPAGLVFLIFRDETKKALLPNEITHLDTVRAMFVRSFPGKLTMSFLESPKRKIYLLEPRTNIYYQLEDLRDIRDRTVLRVHECDSMEPQTVIEKPEVRGRTIQLPATPSQGYYGPLPSSAITSQIHKTQTLPAQMHHPVYMSHDDITQSPARTAYERSRSLTPDPTRTTNYAQNPIYGRMGISPERPPPPVDRAGPPDRPLGLRSIPENYLMLNGHKNGGPGFEYVDNRANLRQAMSPPAVSLEPKMEQPGRRAFSPPANLHNYDFIQVVPVSHGGPTYMAKGVRASAHVTPQRATSALPTSGTTPTSMAGSPSTQQAGPQQTTWRERSPVGRHSLALSSVPYSGPSSGPQQRSQSYRVPSTSDREPMLSQRPRSITPSPMDNYETDLTRNRIDKMENQLAHLAAWVQTAVLHGSTGKPSTPSLSSEHSPVSSITDLGSEGTVALSADMKMNILSIKHQAESLRSDLHSLRRLQQINKESIIETVDDAWKKIRDAMSSVPGAENVIIRQQRNEVDVMYQIYLEDKALADRELCELEQAVEELRSDVLSRQCRVQMSDVEGMALVLSHVTKQLGDLKTRFPKLQERLKHVMAAEMEVIVREEKWLKDEPERLDNSLKKCKKLTGTLFTLKRLASVQEHRPPQVVALSAQAVMPTMQDKRAVLENIQAMVPDHQARLQGIQAAEAKRQIKKKITTQQESLRFGKSLELASKALKPHGAASSHSGAETRAGSQSGHTGSSSPSPYDASSIISFAMPMSTSTPKSGNQHPTSKTESSATSPSMTYPVMSLIETVTPKSDHRGQGQRDQTSEPAILTVTSSEVSSQKRPTEGQSSCEKIDNDEPKSVDLISQKTAARAAFFSSLSSPPTPTTCTSPISTGTTLSIDSPTEGVAKIPSSGTTSARGIPTLVRSMAVSQPSYEISTSDDHSVSSLAHATKPSSLPVSGSSVVSSQRFSPSSPSNASLTQTSNSRPRTTFTAIPKPYSPTKSTPSPLTPESPKYRIPPSQQSRESSGSHPVLGIMKKQAVIGPESGTRPKKIPPPTPPRKSSKLPGQAVMVVKEATINGQLPKAKSKQFEPHISKPSVSFASSTKNGNDIIKPPKQFSSAVELDTKVERKSSVGSLKQFTTPLLESKRDKQDSKDNTVQGKPQIVGKKFSNSNLDSGKTTKQVEKDIDISADDGGDISKLESSRKVIDGKVTNLSDDKTDHTSRGDSVESLSSSGSLDSQKDIWFRRKDEVSEKSSSVTKSTEEESDQSTATKFEKVDPSTASTSSSQTGASDQPEGGKKKVKPPPPERRSSLTSKTLTDEEFPDPPPPLAEERKALVRQSKGSIDRLV